jgi:hypothetical protein
MPGSCGVLRADVLHLDIRQFNEPDNENGDRAGQRIIGSKIAST